MSIEGEYIIQYIPYPIYRTYLFFWVRKYGFQVNKDTVLLFSKGLPPNETGKMFKDPGTTV